MDATRDQELQELRSYPLDMLLSGFPDPPSSAPVGRPTPAVIARLKTATSPRALSVDSRRDEFKMPVHARVGSHDSKRSLGGNLLSINMPLLLKGVRGELSPTEQQVLHGQLLAAPAPSLESTLEKAYKEWETSRGVKPPTVPIEKGSRIGNLFDKSKAMLSSSEAKLPTISISPCLIDFGQGLKIGKPVTAQVTLTATGAKPTASFRTVPHVSSYSILFSPQTVTFKKVCASGACACVC